MKERDLSEKHPDLVPHPRYGVKIKNTYFLSYWQSAAKEIFADTLIKADSNKQVSINTYGSMIEYYVDVLNDCKECGRPFVFYARDQQRWYEEYEIPIYAFEVFCSQCRARKHDIKRAWASLQSVLIRLKTLEKHTGPLSREIVPDEELFELTENSIYICAWGFLKNYDRIYRIRKTLRQRSLNEDDEFSVLAQKLDAALLLADDKK